MVRFFKKYKLYVFLTLFVILCFGIYFYMSYASAPAIFPKGTTINGIDCSSLNAYDASEKLIKEHNKNTFTIKENDKVIGELPLSGTKYDIDEAINKEIKPNFATYLLRKLRFIDKKISIPMKVQDVSKKFKSDFNKISEFDDKKDVVKTKDAYVNLDSISFEIVKEVYGNNIDKDLIKKAIYKKIANGEFNLNFIEKNFYKKPKIISTSSILLEEQDYLIGLDIMGITYKMPKKDVEVKTSEVLKMYGITNKNLAEKMKTVKASDLKAVKKKVENFVEDLAIEYSTVGKMRKFKTHSGYTISINSGDYGYQIDRDSEVKKLIKDLNNKKNVERKPCYYQEPYDKSDKVGKSYVEIDLYSQYLYVYRKGKLMLSTPVVTGDVSNGYSTPAGIYYLKYKQRDTTLQGANSDGSRYASPVSYWMPFNGGIGMHDASWRNSFGGNIYRYSGSHGCVNMPVSAAGSTFGIIDEGYPIVVHY